MHYPATIVPEDKDSENVTVECVENAVVKGSSSLEVTCTSGGLWDDDKMPQCKCIEGYKQTNTGTCIGE